MQIPKPPPAEVIPIDFETYSEAGYYWDEAAQKWRATVPKKPGIKGVGAPVYAEHDSADVLMLNYRQGGFSHVWVPGRPIPQALREHIEAGGLLSGVNVGFERLFWEHVMVKRYGWPEMKPTQWRCTAACARYNGLPGSLDGATKALGTAAQKDKDGARLIRKFTVPRNPTKNNPSLRLQLWDDPADAMRFFAYNSDDVLAEDELRRRLSPMTAFELRVWLLDQEINFRGVHVDMVGLRACVRMVDQARRKLNKELNELTGGAVPTADALAELKAWAAGNGFAMLSADADAVTDALASDALPPQVRRALEIRQVLASKSTSKVYSMIARVSKDGRLHDLFAYCGAERTARWAGRGPQPQNLPKAKLPKGVSVEEAIAAIVRGDLDEVTKLCGCPINAVKAVLRGLFCAAPGHDLIASDFSAIEAVVLAAVAGEEWRLEVFRDPNKDIYLEGVHRLTGTPLDELYGYPDAHGGENHPLRQGVGKVSELASGFGGGKGAWLRFGADKYMTEAEIQANIKKWRNASPMIRRLWYALRDAAVAAVRAPGVRQPVVQRDYNGNPLRTVPGLYYEFRDDGVLYCGLPSGREIRYHGARVEDKENKWGKIEPILSYMNNNTDANRGPVGWYRVESWYGLLVENVVQAIARDIQASALLRLARAGYAIVLHVHDEIVAEVLKGWGSIEEFERIMSEREEWFKDWPINVSGGYRESRYKKG